MKNIFNLKMFIKTIFNIHRVQHILEDLEVNIWHKKMSHSQVIHKHQTLLAIIDFFTLKI